MTPDEILTQAREQFKADEEWERELRAEYREDIRFVSGLQWPDDKKAQREAAGRPCMTHNRLPTYIQNITNEARQNKPSVLFTPVEDDDEKTAEILRGMARHIQYDSQASMAYETASECQVGGSFGHFRMVSDYVANDSFDQELRIKEIVNPLSVYGALRPAIMRQKCRHAFVVETLTREEHKRLYGESGEFLSFAESDTTGWISKDEVRIAEYWWVESKSKTIALLGDGTVIDMALVPPEVHEADGVKDTRKVQVDTVRWCKLNGAEVLKGTETEWVTDEIPIFAVLGKQAIVDDKPMLFSLTRFLRSPQQLVNYTKSRIAEALMTMPVSPWIGVEGQFEGHERAWDEAAWRPISRLEYKPVSVGGQPVGAPQRNTFEPPIAALSAFLMQEIDELKAISGIFDASQGAKSNETSGLAIQARQQQSTQANFHFLDNLGRAHEACGRMLAAAIPKIYDGTRIVRILGEDDTRESAWINKPVVGEDGQQRVENDISAGKYDVVVTVGRTFSTKRLESFDTLSRLVQGNPELLPTIGDIVFRNSDMAGADEISERFKKMLPPNLAEDDKDAPAQIPPQVQQQMQAIQQQNQQLTAALNEFTDAVAAKKMEYESRERIEMIRQQAESMRTLAKLGSQEAVAELRLEIESLGQKIDAGLAAREADRAEEQPGKAAASATE